MAEAQETHVRDTEEWKKFQADLQTAVRVANDFMNGLYLNFQFVKNIKNPTDLFRHLMKSLIQILKPYK